MHNDVPQGLSSAIFTTDLREAETLPVGARLGLRHRQRQHRHLAARRSAAPSAARRRPAAAASRAPMPGTHYMRRATNTVNYSRELPLAQGVSFDV